MRLIISIFCLLTLSCASTKNETLMTPQYTVVKTIENIEIRDYKESINASYYSKENKNNNNFRNLAAYIFGENSENKSIQMTSPVTMKLYGNKEMIFRMPEEYSLENLPKADNPLIVFFEEPSCKKAAISYKGYSNNKIEQKKITELKQILLENNIQHTNEFEVLVYQSPYKILNRRNEITVNITYP